MNDNNGFQYLGPRQGSNYRQWFLKGTRIRAETLDRAQYATDPHRTPAEVARDYHVPVEAVLESIRYCAENEDLLRQERDEELASIRANGWDKPPFAPPDYKPDDYAISSTISKN